MIGRVLLTLAFLGAACAGFAGEDAYAEVEDLLERGLYNSAALVAGPALVEKLPEDRRAWYLQALALFLSGDVREARTAADMMLQLGPDVPEDPAEARLLGLLLAAEHDTAAAIPLLEQAFRETGGYQEAMDLGRIAWQAGDTETALGAFRAAAATPRGSREPWPWLDQGRILLHAGDLDGAEEALLKSIEVYEAADVGTDLPSPAYVEAFFRLGQLEEERWRASGSSGHLEQARINYRNALTGDPNYGPAQDALEALDAGAADDGS